jgi:Rieske Fe-S protein
MCVDQEDRRSILRKFVSAGITLLTTSLAGLLAVVAAPKSSGSAPRWRRAVSMFDLPPNEPMSAVLTDRHADGWYQTTSQAVVFIDRDGQGYRALSATCQHLGCQVHWDQGKHQFLCPCHGGVYDRDGRVVSGPPPRPLERLKVRVNEQTADIEVEL